MPLKQPSLTKFRVVGLGLVDIQIEEFRLC